MNKLQKMVLDFHKKFGYEYHDKLTTLDINTIRFRKNLMIEELQELLVAMDYCNYFKIADGIGDLLYVVIGTAITYGMDVDAIVKEIHESNMSKDVSGDSVKKAIKGDNYHSPDMKKVIK